jgi:DNA-binding MarR family transcriptional regulator
MLTNNANQPRVGALLRMPWQAIRERIHRELVAQGFDDVRLRDLAILQWPGPEGLRPSELAARAHLSKQAAKPLIDHLLDRGYLESSRDPIDNRALHLTTTASGKRLMGAIKRIIEGLEAELEIELGPRRYGQLRSGLEELEKITTGWS